MEGSQDETTGNRYQIEDGTMVTENPSTLALTRVMSPTQQYHPPSQTLLSAALPRPSPEAQAAVERGAADEPKCMEQRAGARPAHATSIRSSESGVLVSWLRRG